MIFYMKPSDLSMPILKLFSVYSELLYVDIYHSSSNVLVFSYFIFILGTEGQSPADVEFHSDAPRIHGEIPPPRLGHSLY